MPFEIDLVETIHTTEDVPIAIAYQMADDPKTAWLKIVTLARAGVVTIWSIDPSGETQLAQWRIDTIVRTLADSGHLPADQPSHFMLRRGPQTASFYANNVARWLNRESPD